MSALTPDFLNALGNKIARLRKRQGLNQFEFADNCGKMVNTISKIERGIGDPRLSTLLDIAKALDISLTDLVDPRFSGISGVDNRQTENIDETIYALLPHCDEQSKQVILALLHLLIK